MLERAREAAECRMTPMGGGMRAVLSSVVVVVLVLALLSGMVLEVAEVVLRGASREARAATAAAIRGDMAISKGRG